MDDKRKRTWAEIDLGAIEKNYKNMRALLPDGCRFLGVVKADAYGHGAIPVGRRLLELGCECLAVACLDEARTLRAAGIDLPILILGHTPPEYAPELSRLHITQAVGSLSYAEALSGALAGTGQTLVIHLEMETGMGRTGFRAFGQDELSGAASAGGLPPLFVEGAFTHFCVSDADASARQYTLEQFSRFRNAVSYVEAALGRRLPIRHCANSGAMISFPETYMDMVRPGVSLYGMYPGPDRGKLALTPAMELYTRACYVEDHYAGDTVSYGRTYAAPGHRRIAVLPIGYADGLHRVLSNHMEFAVNGQRVLQVGRICMDMCMADVTELDVRPGDVFQVFGRQIPVEELAQKAGTINYEMTCAVSPRVPRVHLN